MSNQDKQLLLASVLVAQQHARCPFNLQEADLLKRCKDSTTSGSGEIPEKSCLEVFIQAVQKAQKNGVYSLEDASNLYQAILRLAKSADAASSTKASPPTQGAKESLSEPVPLNRVI